VPHDEVMAEMEMLIEQIAAQREKR